MSRKNYLPWVTEVICIVGYDPREVVIFAFPLIVYYIARNKVVAVQLPGSYHYRITMLRTLTSPLGSMPRGPTWHSVILNQDGLRTFLHHNHSLCRSPQETGWCAARSSYSTHDPNLQCHVLSRYRPFLMSQTRCNFGKLSID